MLQHQQGRKVQRVKQQVGGVIFTLEVLEV